jgi:hypothetical protein
VNIKTDLQIIGQCHTLYRLTSFELKKGQVKKANKSPVLGQNIRNYKNIAFLTPQMNTGTGTVQ